MTGHHVSNMYDMSRRQDGPVAPRFVLSPLPHVLRVLDIEVVYRCTERWALVLAGLCELDTNLGRMNLNCPSEPVASL